MEFTNVYEDTQRADAYAKLEFPGTYYLAYRDLPEIIFRHVEGKKALDFGCGTGRSTRFLTNIGFDSIGVDISDEMLRKAKGIDPHGGYVLVQDGDFNQFKDGSFDLILSVFTFDNIPTKQKKVKNFTELARLLKKEGRIVNLVSSPEIYIHEWTSFTTRDFPENKLAKSGDKVKIVMKDVADRRPVEDVIWSGEDYQKVYKKAGLEIVKIFKPLAKEDEPYQWINETEIPPWDIYVLKRSIVKKNS
jgi:ubiquinone/menaquinone biosynthesis C-methylase UbiE